MLGFRLLRNGQRWYSDLKGLAKHVRSSKSALLMVPSMAATTFVFEDSDKTSSDLPKEPIDLPNSNLSLEFLLKQSSILSEEAASRLLMHFISSLDIVVSDLISRKNELADLYELSGGQYQLTDAGEARIVTLRNEIKVYTKQLSDLELMFEYIRKLMDSNSEVCFLVGERFASEQASLKIHNACEHIKSKLDAVKRAEIDLIEAHTAHIANQTQSSTESDEGETKSDETVSLE